MTAEAAVVNKSAVALAADSLATITRAGDRDPRKTHEVNKLFTLSKFHPVGIMVFADSEFMGVPWETVIKEYRRALGSSSFDTIQGYTDHFLEWIASSNLVCPDAAQRHWFRYIASSYFGLVVNVEIDRRVKATISDSGPITEEQIQEIVASVIEHFVRELEGFAPRPYLNDAFSQSLETQYATEIDAVISESLNERPMTEEIIGNSKKIATMLFSRQSNIPTYSGVVFAGFGNEEVFPVVRTIGIHGAVVNQPISYVDEEDCVEAGTVAVIPFAQRDVADTFLHGVNPDAIATITNYLTQILNRLPGIVAGSIEDDDAKRRALTQQLESATANATEHFRNRLLTWLQKRHIEPLLEFLRHAPKEELAELAESLVSLTSIKRKVEEGLPTVGGPIDVAIITKGDGFVWIRRKYYFDPQLNFAFRDRYFAQ